MKKSLFRIFMIAVLITVVCYGYAHSNDNWKIELVERHSYAKLKGYPNIVYKTNLKSGKSIEICDLFELGVAKPGNYIYDTKRDILFIDEYNGRYYNIKVIDLKKKESIKTIVLNTIEPNVTMTIDSYSGILYVTFYDQNNDITVTSIFDEEYEILKKIPNFTVGGDEVYSSKDGKHHYFIGYDTKMKEQYFIIIDAISGDIIKKKGRKDVVIKGEYVGIRDCKEGMLLLEYRLTKEEKESETYMLYDPLEDKVLSRIDNVPFHVGNVYLDDDLNHVIIEEAQDILKDDKQVREYSGKIEVYDFKTNKKVKEFNIGKISKVELVGKGGTYYIGTPSKVELVEEGVIYYKEKDTIKKLNITE